VFIFYLFFSFFFFIFQTADLSLVFKDSSPSTPLIFVLSVGTDPAADLYKFAEEMRFSKKLNAISLGQGQVWLQIPRNILSVLISDLILHSRCQMFTRNYP